MMAVEVGFNREQLALAKDALLRTPELINKALARAINRAIDGGRTDAIRTICEEYSIKPMDVRKTIHVVRAHPGKLSAQILCSGSPLPLAKFNVKPKSPPKRGTPVDKRRTVTAGVKQGSAKEMPRSFVAQMKSGHRGVFTRDGSGRLSIEQLYSPSAPQMFGNTNVLRLIEENANKRLDKELRHQIQFLRGGGR